MGAEVTRFFLRFIGICCLTTPMVHAQQNAIKHYSQNVLFKNWVLSRCLAKAYSSDESKKDAEVTASAYLEFGKAGIEAYEKADVLVGKYLATTYDGSVHSSYNTMKCIDLFHSRDLDSLAKKYAK